MSRCPPCFEVVRFDFSFTLAMAAKEINRLIELIEQHELELLEKWYEFFSG